ncbi:MAG: helix-turn-helix transcriptional regulator [Myxococcaceae bacterium]|nr:helix-turn-helix transcriptional regulator [Myxococcaceae bacterium]
MRRDAKAPRGLVSAPPPGAFEHRRVVPTGRLEERVAHFWWVRWRVEAAHRVVTVPHPTVHLVFEPPGAAEVVGIPARRFERRLSGSGFVFGVKFRPGGFSGLSPGGPRALFGRRQPAVSVLGRPLGALTEAVAKAGSMEACMDAAEAGLAWPRLSPEACEARDLMEQLEGDRSCTRVDQLATRAGVSVRALQRLLLTHVGVGPKWALLRYRLHEAAERLKDPRIPLADLAASLSYADQAHFTRDFTRVIGQSPAAFRALHRQSPESA